MKSKILSLLFIFLLIGCEKDEFFTNSDQEIYFRVDAINFAWIFYHAGFMIDSSGYVRGYNLPKVWNWEDSLGYIAKSKMKENIGQLDTIITKINRDTLKKYINKIKKASRGPITDPVTQMFDAGTTRYSAYLFDSGSQKYKEVIIKQIGDQFIDNKSPEANQIYNWINRSRAR